LTKSLTITSTSTVAPADFIFLSTPSGGQGEFYSAARLEGGQGGQNWAADDGINPVPLPGALWAGTALLGMIGLRRVYRRSR